MWDGYPWGDYADMRVYPFISYFEVIARYQIGLDPSALTLIRREWGYMLANGPRSTMWETIGAYGGAPVDLTPSYDHGWSSGAAPALTNYALGVQPASPGFGSYVAQPHPADLKWARGTVPTPHGAIGFRWSVSKQELTATVVAPVGGTIILPGAGPSMLDGKTIPEQRGETSVTRRPRDSHARREAGREALWLDVGGAQAGMAWARAERVERLGLAAALDAVGDVLGERRARA